MTHLIQIGNSHGIRIPKATIQQAGLMDAELMLTVVAEGLLITPLKSPRANWAETIRAIETNKQEQELLTGEVSNKFDEDDWEW